MEPNPHTIVDLARHPWPFVTVDQFAAYLNVPISVVYRHVDKGALTVLRFGRSVRIPIEEACAYCNVTYLGCDDPANFATPFVVAPEHRGGVYFVLGAALIKVGRADHFRRRLAGLYTLSPVPLSLLAIIELPDRANALAVEQELHARFAPARVKGEWFHAAPVQQFLETEFDRQAGRGRALRPPAHDLSAYQSWRTPCDPRRARDPHSGGRLAETQRAS